MTLTPAFDAADFAEALAHLTPPGAAWPRELDSLQAQVRAGLAESTARVQRRAVTLGDEESDPARAVLLLPDWERAYGLPDPCTPLNASLAERRARLLARIVEQGGQRPDYYVAVAGALGFAVTVEQLGPAVIEEAAIEDEAREDEWAFTWIVRAPAETVIEAAIEESGIEDPLSSVGNQILECVIRRIAPAHTTVLFAYG